MTNFKKIILISKEILNYYVFIVFHFYIFSHMKISVVYGIVSSIYPSSCLFLPSCSSLYDLFSLSFNSLFSLYPSEALYFPTSVTLFPLPFIYIYFLFLKKENSDKQASLFSEMF